MRKIFLALATVLCVTQPYLAIAETSSTKTPSKQKLTTPTHKKTLKVAKKSPAASEHPTAKHQTATKHQTTAKHPATATKKTTPKNKHSHHRHTTPQIKPQALNSADPPAVASSVPTAAAEPATTDSSHLFSWNNKTTTSSQTSNTNADTTASNSWTHNLEQRVTSFAHNTVANLHYSSYKFGGNRFDPQHGVYMLDCSSYVDNLLHESSPGAYSVLAQWSGSYKPNSEHYYNFFNRLVASDESYRWNKVADPQKLQAGDILVFRYTNSRGRANGGHVMVVMDKPVGRNADILQVRVADSAAAGHSADTRGTHSGIGIGTLLLRVNPATGQPYAFAWRIDSPWNSRVNIAMGRPPSA